MHSELRLSWADEGFDHLQIRMLVSNNPRMTPEHRQPDIQFAGSQHSLIRSGDASNELGNSSRIRRYLEIRWTEPAQIQHLVYLRKTGHAPLIHVRFRY